MHILAQAGRGIKPTDPGATQIGGDNFFSLPASVTVTSATVPEPAMTLPLGLGLAELLWLLDRRHPGTKAYKGGK
jgi:hypothetical protein